VELAITNVRQLSSAAELPKPLEEQE